MTNTHPAPTTSERIPCRADELIPGDHVIRTFNGAEIVSSIVTIRHSASFNLDILFDDGMTTTTHTHCTWLTVPQTPASDFPVPTLCLHCDELAVAGRMLCADHVALVPAGRPLPPAPAGQHVTVRKDTGTGEHSPYLGCIDPHCTGCEHYVTKVTLLGPAPWGGSLTGAIDDPMIRARFAAGWTVLRTWDVHDHTR